MEVPQEKVTDLLTMYENELVSAKFYENSMECYMHQCKASTIRFVGLSLGLFDDDLIAGAVKRANSKIKAMLKNRS